MQSQEEKAQERRFYLTMVVGGVSLLSFTQLFKYQMECHRKKRAIIQAEKARVYTPEQLLKKISERTNGLQDLEKLSGFKHSNNQNTEIKGRVFLTGVIKCDKPILSPDNFFGDYRMKGLVYQINYDEEKYSLDQIDSSKREYILRDFPENAVFQQVKQFELQDQQGSNSCTVPITENLDVTRALQLIGQKDKLISVSIGQRLLGLLIMLIKLVMDLTVGKTHPFSKSIKGIRLGITEKEIGIKVESIISVYGEVFFNLETGKLRFILPDALVNDKNQFLYKLKESLLESRVLRNFFGVIFASTMVYLGRRVYLYMKKNPDFKPLETINNLINPNKKKNEQL